jgi:WD40 repeat protein
MTRVFLSYGHDELAVEVDRIKASLEARGYPVWFDLERLRAGRDWEAYIEEGLRECDQVVLVMTPHSVRRRDARVEGSTDGYCLNELAKALQWSKRIIPVLLADVPGGAPVSISRLQYLDLRQAIPSANRPQVFDAGIERLVAALEGAEPENSGGQARLIRLLHPIDFSSEMERHVADFLGRAWLDVQIDDWLREKSPSRVFWLTGGPGVGKTAFSVHLAYRRADVVAFHACVHGHAEKSDARRAVTSIAYQMSQAFPALERALQEEDLERVSATADAGSLFERLLVKPLGGTFTAPDGPRLVVIDGLDEATAPDGSNAIARLISDYWDRTPQWLRLVITSRPESAVTTPLAGLAPFVLDAAGKDNLADVRDYLAHGLDQLRAAGRLPAAARDSDALLEALVERSEGMFLYARSVIAELEAGRLTAERISDLPRGLGGIYERFFSRQFPDAVQYGERIGPALAVICAQAAPLPVPLLERAMGLLSIDVRKLLAAIGSMFPIRHRQGSAATDTVTWFHKSVFDWLTAIDDRTGYPSAGRFAIDPSPGVGRLAQTCWDEYQKPSRPEPSAYAVRHLVRHFVQAGRSEEAKGLLQDPTFMARRLAPGGVAELLSEFEQLGGELDGALPLVRDALRLSTQIIDRQPQQLCVQLVGRLVGQVRPHLGSFLERVRTHCPRPALLPLLPSLTAAGGALVRTLEGHRGSPSSVAITPDGKTLVSGAFDETLREWELPSGRCLRVLEGKGGSVFTVAITPDGTRVVSGSDNGIATLWELGSGTILRRLEGHRDRVMSVAITPDGRCAVIAGGRTVKLWELTTGTVVRTFEVELPWISSVALDGRGERIAAACGGDKEVMLLEVSSGRLLHRLVSDGRGVSAVAFNRDGKTLLAGTQEGPIVLWDLASGATVRALDGHQDAVFSLAVDSAGHRALSGSVDKTARLWDIDSGKTLQTFDGHSHSVLSVAFDPSGTFVASGSADGTVKLWSLGAPGTSSTLERHSGWVGSLALHPDGVRVLSAGGKGQVKVWEVATGRLLRTFQWHDDSPLSVSSVSLSPDGRCVLSASGERLALHDIDSGELIRDFEGSRARINHATFSRDAGWILSASSENDVVLWDASTGTMIRRFEGHGKWVTRAIFLPGDARVVSGSYDGTVRVWDAASGSLVRIIDAQDGWITSLAATADGTRILVGTYDKDVKVWDVESGKLLQAFGKHRGFVQAVFFDGERSVVSGSDDHDIQLWEVGSGRRVACFTTEAGVSALASRDDAGEVLAGDHRGVVHRLALLA